MAKQNQAAILKKQLVLFDTELVSFVSIMGNDAVEHFSKSFPNQGFTNEVLSKWPERKPTRDNRWEDWLRGILIKTGRLSKSIQIFTKTNRSVKVGSNVGYGSYHNDGTDRLPQREFIGDSYKLNEKIQGKLNILIEKVFK